MDEDEKLFRATITEVMRWTRQDERNRIIQLLEGINPGDGVLGDDLGLAITLIKGEEHGANDN